MKAFSNVRCQLGEGPVWDGKRNCLWWVDIHGKRILRQFWDSRSTDVFPCDARPSALGLHDRNSLVVAFEDGIYTWDIDHNQRQLVKEIDEPPHNRTNDGKIGPNGRFWFGTMDDNEKLNSGSLYSLDRSGLLKQHKTNIGISNTFAWHPESGTFYFADSKAQRIYKTSFTEDSIGNFETFVDLSGTDIYPDGSCIDDEGHLWNAQWDGSRVVRYAQSGRVKEIISLPVLRPTSCCFGGPELDHLFITTASIGLNEANLNRYPMSGHVIAVKTITRGVASKSW